MLYTIFELDTFTADEMTWLDFLITSWCARSGPAVLQKNGLPADRLMVVPLGVDANVFSATSVAPVDGETHFLPPANLKCARATTFSPLFLLKPSVRMICATDAPCMEPFLDDAYNEVWVDLFKKTPMAARVSRERFHSQTALSKLMAGADCGVFLSRAEGWNLGLLEMMAMGKPVITTITPGTPSLPPPPMRCSWKS